MKLSNGWNRVPESMRARPFKLQGPIWSHGLLFNLLRLLHLRNFSVTMKVDGMGKRHEWKEQMNGSTHRGKTCYIGISMLIYVLSIRLNVH